MVSEDFVVSLYRVLFGREPESSDVVKLHARDADDEKALLRNFLGSREFLARGLNPLAVGRHVHPEVLPIDMSASPEQLREMLAGIAGKWLQFGNTEPYWSVLTHESFRSSNIEATREHFYASAYDAVDIALRAARRSGVDTAAFKSATDFGCGVGRLTLALAKHVGFVTGIDISAAHVRLAQNRARETQVSNVAFRVIGAVSDIATTPKADFLMSLIVLQHNPPPVMAEIFASLLRLLNVNGVAYIQMPTFIDGYTFNVADYLKGAKVDMEMNFLPQKRIFEIIREEGCIALEVREDGWPGSASMVSHTFLIQKP
jgi:SAM-dependent methyltransferase